MLLVSLGLDEPLQDHLLASVLRVGGRGRGQGSCLVRDDLLLFFFEDLNIFLAVTLAHEVLFHVLERHHHNREVIKRLLDSGLLENLVNHLPARLVDRQLLPLVGLNRLPSAVLYLQVVQPVEDPVAAQHYEIVEPLLDRELRYLRLRYHHAGLAAELL